jgi:hypothetical protein
MQPDVKAPENGNNGRLVPWILGALAGPAIAIVSGWVASTNTRINGHGEHIAVMEAQLNDVRGDLQRINAKLDRLIDQRSKP